MMRKIDPQHIHMEKACPHYGYEYTPADISALRLYIKKLPEADQRAFLSARLIVDQAKIARITASGRTLKGKRIRDGALLEKPEVLRRLLLEYAVHNRRLPEIPVLEDCENTCIEFILWACDRHKNFLYQNSKEITASSAEGHKITRADRDFCVDPVRKTVDTRDSPKTNDVLRWFEEEEHIACALPTDDTVVLSYATRMQAHASYVMRMEVQHKQPWADQTSDIYLNNLNYLEGDEDEDEMEAQKASCTRTKDRTKYRYQNTLLGLKQDGVPEDKEIATYSWFSGVWQDHEKYPHLERIRVRKWIPFAKCDACSANREAQHTTKDSSEKHRLAKEHHRHINFVRRERNKYEHNRRSNPEEVLSLIIDGADASRFSLPHFAHQSHSSAEAWQLRTHIIGAIAHQRDTYAFTCPSHIAQGHNVTIQVLKEVLLDVKRKEGKLPPKLCLQLDNTTKQNKGRFLFTFLAMLLHDGIFKEIEGSFLPVGHTHEDIDQFFSRMSVYLRSHNAPSRRALGQCIQRAYTKNGKVPIIKHWDSIANISAYLDSRSLTK